MEYRQLIAEDASAYWELRLEALQNSPEAFGTSYEEAIQRDNPIERVKNNFKIKGNYTFGAFDQDKLIGMVTLVQESSLKMKHRANIFAMYVSPTGRGKGIGKALMELAIIQAKESKEIEKINLSVVSSNEAAKNLYLQLGFNVFGKEEMALKVGEIYYEELHMELILK
ncbi:Ribosomal protein S18 acetylase RimI [Psychrobacillus sp. OK028]|uniref:GNAT family N-acetyltransferase n=1 Tax=Psychrobacillus sp. OK028 TaxID=1884359 RepID=UPI00088155EB|nr:GNAT family N-acetyltransferase [Psychrobacillus sp. OK028]SDN46338.1 Ribosomal protein S18 acetylase RimI [Psychrobacillus sp. OK028]